MDGLSGQGEMHSGEKREKHLDDPQSSAPGAIVSHKGDPSEAETERGLAVCHIGHIILFPLIISGRSLLIRFFPVEFGLCIALMQWLFEACDYKEARGYTVTAGS